MTSKAGKELIGLSAAQARKKIVSILKSLILNKNLLFCDLYKLKP